jgi:hypothetical protein
MDLKQSFAQKIIPIKEKLSDQDYQMVLEAAEDYGHSLLLANILARIINMGLSVHIYWQELKDKKHQIFIEADNLLTGEHIDCSPIGYPSAEEAMKGLIDIMAARIKEQDANKKRIIRSN